MRHINGIHVANMADMAERGTGIARNLVIEEDPLQQVAVWDHLALVCTL